MRVRRPVPVVASLLALSLAAAACSGDTTTDSPETEAPVQAVEVSFGIQGAAEELDAWEQVVADHNASSETLEASVVRWETPDHAREAIIDGDLPTSSSRAAATSACCRSTDVRSPSPNSWTSATSTSGTVSPAMR